MGDEARNACRRPPPCSVRNLKSVIPKKGEVPVNGTIFSGDNRVKNRPKPRPLFHRPFRRLWFRGSGRGQRRPPKNADQDRPPGNAARNADQDRRPAPYATRNLYFRKKLRSSREKNGISGRQPPPPSRASPITESGFGGPAAPPSRTILGFLEGNWAFGREIRGKLTIFLKKRKIFRI